MLLIDKNLIKKNLVAKTDEDALAQIGGVLYDNGYIKSTYVDAVIERERNFPTGLKLEYGVNIAMPHADTIHVKKTAIAFATLKNSVPFHLMTDKSKVVDVSLIIMFAITDPKQHLGNLKDAMNFFQNEQATKKVIESQTVDEAYEILTQFFIN